VSIAKTRAEEEALFRTPPDRGERKKERLNLLRPFTEEGSDLEAGANREGKKRGLPPDPFPFYLSPEPLSNDIEKGEKTGRTTFSRPLPRERGVKKALGS